MTVAYQYERKLFGPALRRISGVLGECADLLLRVLVGVLFIPHGYAKLFVATGKFITFFDGLGFNPAIVVTYFIGSLEFFGGLAIIFGFLTRPLAFMLFFEMAVAAVMVHLPKGWSSASGGAEYVVALSAISLILALRGGGRWSLDRLLFRREF